MAGADVDLLAITRGTVTAPAGCGKTHLIAESLTRHTGNKPILVLTHTNAGVCALRSRLNRAGVPLKAYRLSTIDGWAMRLISTFPARSAFDPSILELANPETDYPNIRVAAFKLLKAGHVSDILSANYAQLIVDEYQDCSIRQHTIVAYASQTLPTCVLGDPMQAIFGFGIDHLVGWETHVCRHFPLLAELTTPWRWINAHEEPLGNWLLDVRGKLQRGEPIDLGTAPATVRWVELDGAQAHRQRLSAALARSPTGGGGVLVIGDSTNPSSHRLLASQTPGAVTVEAVELKDFISFSQRFQINEPNALESLIDFAHNVMTNVEAATLLQRINSLKNGTARKPPSVIEQLAISFDQAHSYNSAIDFLVEISNKAGVRTYRPMILRGCISALHICAGTSGVPFHDAAVRIREQYRFAGRSLPRRAVGSTLLFKGLEADVSVVLNANALDARNLYVALTRGSKSLVVCSRTPILNPVR